MKKFNTVTGVITFIVAFIGILFTLMNPDYTVVDYGRGYKNAVDNYRYGYTDVPFTTSLNGHSYATQEGERQYLEVTSRGRVYSMEMPDLAPASMSMCVTADIFPSVLFHSSVILVFGLLIQAISYMWVRGCQPAVSTLWRGRVEEAPVVSEPGGGLADV